MGARIRAFTPELKVAIDFLLGETVASTYAWIKIGRPNWRLRSLELEDQGRLWQHARTVYRRILIRL